MTDKFMTELEERMSHLILNLEAMVEFLYPDEMTPIAKRQFDSVFSTYEDLMARLHSD